MLPVMAGYPVRFSRSDVSWHVSVFPHTFWLTIDSTLVFGLYWSCVPHRGNYLWCFSASHKLVEMVFSCCEVSVALFSSGMKPIVFHEIPAWSNTEYLFSWDSRKWVNCYASILSWGAWYSIVVLNCHICRGCLVSTLVSISFCGTFS